MNSRGNTLVNTDWLTVIFYLLLVVFGWLNIYSVNYDESAGFVFSLTNKYSMQMIWIAVSIGLAILIFLMDSRFYSFIAYPGYLFSLFLLLLVLVIGQEVNGAKSWISLGPVKIQPSEFAKLATILVLAKFLSGYNIKSDSLKNILISLGLIVTPLAFIMLQPDFGSTLVYGTMLLVLYREGLPGWVLLIIVFLAGVFLGFFLLSPLNLLIVITVGAYLGFFIINKRFKNLLVGLVILAVCVLIAFGLQYKKILPQNNYTIFLGSLIVAVSISIIISLRKKIHGAFVIVLFLFSFIGFVYSIDYMFHNLMKPHHQQRVEVMLGKRSDPWGYEYNVNQSYFAIV